MVEYNEIFELIFDNLKRIIFPEEWLSLDLEMSKQELFSLLLLDRQGEISMSQVADQINIPMSTATGIIDRLVKKGYIVRSRSESDRRIVSILLTDKGKDFTEQMKAHVSGYVKKVYDVLTEEEKQWLFSIFTKVMATLQEAGQSTSNEGEAKKAVKKIEIE